MSHWAEVDNNNTVIRVLVGNNYGDEGYQWLKAYEQGGISYAEMKGYKPTQIGCPVITVNPSANEFKVVT